MAGKTRCGRCAGVYGSCYPPVDPVFFMLREYVHTLPWVHVWALVVLRGLQTLVADHMRLSFYGSLVASSARFAAEICAHDQQPSGFVRRV